MNDEQSLAEKTKDELHEIIMRLGNAIYQFQGQEGLEQEYSFLVAARSLIFDAKAVWMQYHGLEEDIPF